MSKLFFDKIEKLQKFYDLNSFLNTLYYKMSYLSLIETLIGRVTGGAIIGMDGGIWASTPGFYGSTFEFSNFRQIFFPNSELIYKGILFMGELFVVTDIKKDIVIAKKGTITLIVSKCKDCIVLGYNDNQIKFETCFKAVNELCQQIKEN